jgi:HlyD family secretion protein
MRCIRSFVGAGLLLLVACGNGDDVGHGYGERTFLAVAVRRESVTMKVSATGVLQPVQEIDIKSKASGKILRLPVETGQVVERGELLVQVDTSDVAADLRQRLAQIELQRAEYARAERQKVRADGLLVQGMIADDEHDDALLNFTRARVNLVAQESELAKAQERMDETIVRAPARGTILARKVALGQVIASGTSGFSEGTTLMKMADLSTMQVRALVDEADIGKVRTGLQAVVRVDAYPDRTFTAKINKIEPVSEEQQNVTFFPVLIDIDNGEGLLLPGMRSTVDIVIFQKDSVLAVASDALVSVQDAVATGKLLGIPEDTSKALLQRAGVSPMPTPLPSMGMPGVRPTTGAGAQDRAVVFVVDSVGFHPVVVKTGIRDWKVTEVVEGVAEATQVIVPPSATIAQQFAQYREMARKYTSIVGRK